MYNPNKTLFFSLQVNLNREITFKNSKRTYKGVPVIASNMDTVGTFEMAKTLAKVCTKKKKKKKNDFVIKVGLYLLLLIMIY
jgi:hypothetical protein